MGGFISKYLSISVKMETQIVVDKPNRVEKLLMKPTNVSKIPVSVQLTPLDEIKDIKDTPTEKTIERKLKKRSRSCKNRGESIKLSVHDCNIKITRIDWSHHLQKKRVKVDLKRIKLPKCFNPTKVPDIICNNLDLASNNNDRGGLKSNPKTLKDRQNNENILCNFNKNHSDDLFDSVNIPNYFSKVDPLENSFSSDSSDEETSSDNNNNSPITNHFPNFEGWSGWSPATPDHIRGENEVDETPRWSSQLAFVHKTLGERKKQKIALGKGIPQGIEILKNGTKHLGKSSFPKKKSRLVFDNLRSNLEPALVNINKIHEDTSEEEMEPYFEEEQISLPVACVME